MMELNKTEARIYVQILGKGLNTITALAEATGMSHENCRRTVHRLKVLGAVEVTTGSKYRFIKAHKKPYCIVNRMAKDARYRKATSRFGITKILMRQYGPDIVKYVLYRRNDDPSIVSSKAGITTKEVNYILDKLGA